MLSAPRRSSVLPTFVKASRQLLTSLTHALPIESPLPHGASPRHYLLYWTPLRRVTESGVADIQPNLDFGAGLTLLSFDMWAIALS